MRSAALKLTLALALLVSPSVAMAAGGANPGRVLAIGCAGEHYKPRSIVLACGDGGIWLSGLHWSRWSRSTAHATGTFNWNDCKPDCAQGHRKSVPVKVTLSKPKACTGRAHLGFGVGTFAFPAGHPPYNARRWAFPCPF